MSPTVRASISSFPRAHAFSTATFSVSKAQVRSYLDATGDPGDYGSAIPPLAAVALALEVLQQEVALPEGSLHTAQEVEQLARIPIGDPLTLSTRVAQRSERQGFVISVLELEIAPSTGVAIRARATIMVPGAGA